MEELELLKKRADVLGISYHPNIGVEALRNKVNAKLAESQGSESEEEEQEEMEQEQEQEEQAPARPLTKHERENAIRVERTRQQNEYMKLVRIRIACLNPAKKELKGEIVTFQNRFLGEVKKFVPYGEESDAGYHVPQCIYQVLKDRQFASIRKVKGKNGVDVVSTRNVPEFAIEVLPQLTKQELAELAAAQAAGHSID